MKNILIAGFQHETNTFGPSQATFEEFLEADGWPGLLTGDEVINGTRGINLPIAGFIEATQGSDMNLLPVVWASAEPSGFVTDDAFERISDMILQGIRSTPSLDGIYLDLHGAMVTQSHQDGEGELLARIRDLTGDDLPIVASLDLHANITARMVRHASAFCIFRTYPHIDMARTGARCYPVLRHLLSGTRLHAQARNAVLALLHDPNVSARAHKLGVGATFEAALGGRTGLAGMESYCARFRVLALSDGQFAFGGEMYAGAKAQLGPTALLEIVDPNSSVCVVVGSKRCQCLDRTIFTHLGIELEKTGIIAVKSTVHFRADFEPIAGR
ncbi:MAG: M81 family peptidase, partial [Gammaproteobacteria bacterium]|nr:M81 family peptidase [Gammaproteobacteria bacterium]